MDLAKDYSRGEVVRGEGIVAVGDLTEDRTLSRTKVRAK
jgi:hypothetical protein